MNLKRHLHTYVHSSIIQCNQEVEATYMSISGWVVIYVVYSIHNNVYVLIHIVFWTFVAKHLNTPRVTVLLYSITLFTCWSFPASKKGINWKGSLEVPFQIQVITCHSGQIDSNYLYIPIVLMVMIINGNSDLHWKPFKYE